jgi:RNA-directed DNA polymerase
MPMTSLFTRVDITVVQRCQQTIAEWLEGMGLELKPSKTRLTHTLNKYGDNEPGFNFLGFNVRQFPAGKYTSGKNTNRTLLGFKTIITPSSRKLKVHYEKIVDTINAHKSAPQTALICNLNPIIRGWANYYSTVASKKAYGQLDHLMYKKLRVWAKHRHHNKTAKWIAKKYWQTIGGDNWVFATRQEGKNPMRLLKHNKTHIVRYVKVKGEASPFDGNLIYWSSRMGTHPEATIRRSTLLKKQKGKCNHCGLHFREEDVLEIDHIDPKGKDEYKNLQILHRHCHDTKTAEDGSAVGTHDKRQIIEEPDEVESLMSGSVDKSLW